MVYYSACIFFVINESWYFIFPVLKFLLIFLLLILFYNFFVKPRIHRKNRNRNDFELPVSMDGAKVQIELLRDKKNNASLISLIIRNTGNREVDLDAPVLVFKRWALKRKFRIVSVDYSVIYPIFIDRGKTSVVNIDLEQFYGYAPELRRANKLGVEMKEVNGRKFKSRAIRLKWC